MYLQGNLQTVFDALYNMGVIDPVLEMDWSQAMEHLPEHFSEFLEVVQVVNRHQSDTEDLVEKLKRFDEVTLSYLAMEVAREYADFHAREDLH